MSGFHCYSWDPENERRWDEANAEIFVQDTLTSDQAPSPSNVQPVQPTATTSFFNSNRALEDVNNLFIAVSLCFSVQTNEVITAGLPTSTADSPQGSAAALPGKFLIYYKHVNVWADDRYNIFYGFRAPGGIKIIGGTLELGSGCWGAEDAKVFKSQALVRGETKGEEDACYQVANPGDLLFIKLTLDVPDPPKPAAEEISRNFARSCTGE